MGKSFTDDICVLLQSLMLVVAGAAGLVVNTVVLRYLLHCVGETGVLYIGQWRPLLHALCGHRHAMPCHASARRMHARCMH